MLSPADLPPEVRGGGAAPAAPQVMPSISAASAAVVATPLTTAQSGSSAPSTMVPVAIEGDWRDLLRAELVAAIRSGQEDGQLFDRLSGDFERVVYGTALEKTRGKRLEAASLLGVGRNTITRKIQELSLEEPQVRSDFGGLASR